MTQEPPADTVIELTLADSDRIADLHRAAFPADQAWSADQFATLLRQDSVLARAIMGEEDLLSVLLVQIAVDQAEILTLATAPDHRRQGHAARILAKTETELIDRGITNWLLDVAEDNQAALNFYERLGFQPDGRRRGYYKRLEGNRVDAILMSRPMARQAAT